MGSGGRAARTCQTSGAGAGGPSRGTLGGMIVLGIVCIVAGVLVAKLAVLITVGIVLLAAGLILALLGAIGHPVGGRRWWG
jgi:hypothetical protein